VTDVLTGGEDAVLDLPGPAGKVAVAPQVSGLEQNYPNPFNPTTTIRYALGEPSEVRLTIYNAVGQQIRVLVEGHHQAGSYEATWDATDDFGSSVSSGIYLYHFESEGFVERRRMLLLH
jgi:hypothetical protein